MFVFIALLAALLQQEARVGTIEGMVVHRETNAPISEVRIKANTTSGEPVEATTDATGRFVLRNVPPGLVGIEASADGYMFTLRLSGSSLTVGSHNLLSINGVLYPRRTLGFSVTLAPGENLKLPPIPAASAASLRGRVVDSEGRGVAGATVGFSTAISGGATGSPLMAEVRSTKTDEQGEYRSATLSPGTYYLKATMDRPNASRLTVFYPATIDLSRQDPGRDSRTRRRGIGNCASAQRGY